MRISIKSNKEIEKMRIAGSLAAEVLEMISPFVVPGISTGELDKICYEHIVNKQNAIPANVGYKGYEKTICSSINQVICHGIPNNEKFLKEGDILNIDVTVIKDGWHGDTSKMFLVGKCAPHNERLVKITQECLYKGINEVKPGAYLGDIGYAIQKHAEENYYSVVEDYCGHGIGSVYHEEPQVLHYGKRGTGMQLKEGMCFTIEPMINAGDKGIFTADDGWTIYTIDGQPSAHFEHTIAITDNRPKILSKGTNG